MIGGVDYSTKAVHGAIVDSKQLRFIKRYDLGGDPTPVLQELAEDFGKRGVEVVYLEAPFFVPARIDREGKLRQGSNVNTLKLHRIPTIFETVAKLAKKPLEVRPVAPATWKSVMLKHVPAEGTKAQSMWLALRAFGYDTRDDNAADAIIIAAYGDLLKRTHGLVPP